MTVANLMDDVHLHEREFELRFLKSRGAGFQDLFSDVMERVFPADFQRIRPHGNTGDMKCDGYLRSGRTVFQVYGPEEIRRIGRLLTKISEDFAGAVAQWGDRMRRWIFVHNCQPGLPAQAVQKLEEFGAGEGAPTIEVWGFSEILRLVRGLSPADLRGLFPVPVSPTGAQLPRLPGLEAAQSYWTWLCTRAVDESSTSIATLLRGLELPIRLLRPEDELRLRSEEERIERERQEEIRDAEQEKIEEFNVATLHRLLRDHPRLLVLGDSGSGKTTLLRRIAIAEAERLRRRGLRRRSRRTPVLVDLWRFSGARSVVDLMVASVTEANAGIRAGEILASMERGYLLILLDGADEIPADLRRECFAQILTLSQQYPRCRFILTSRRLPGLPTGFRTLAIGPLRDEDIAAAIAARSPSTRAFRDKFGGMTPSDYVRLEVPPAVRQLCRRPLTLALVLRAIWTDGDLPATWFQAYERFIAWVLGWENQKDRLPSALAAMEALQETAYRMTADGAVALPLPDWTRAAGRAVERVRSECGTTAPPEDLLRLLSSTGLIRTVGGEVSFSHGSLQEYFAAKRIMGGDGPVGADPVAAHPGVAHFLCGGMTDPTPLLKAHLDRSEDAQAIMPLLLEAERAATLKGSFVDLRNAIALGTEMDVELTYGLRGPSAEVFIHEVENLVGACMEFGPKTRSVLTDAAHGVIFGVHWEQSRQWFDRIVEGLEKLGWSGSKYHRQLVSIGFFEAAGAGAFSDDGTNPDDAARLEQLYGYMGALRDGHWEKAAEHLRVMSDLIRKVEAPKGDAREGHPERELEPEREYGTMAQKHVAERGDGTTEQPQLPVVEEIFRLNESSPICPNCGGTPRPMAELYEHWEVVDVAEAGYRLVRTKQQVYACSCGGCTAPGLERTTPGSHYSLAFAIKVAVDKYRDDVPLSRQARILSEHGVDVTKPALWDQLNALARRLEPVDRALLEYVLAQPVIGLSRADATILDGTQRKPWPVWCVTAPGVVVYRVRDDKGAEPVKIRIGAYRGVIVCDTLEMQEALTYGGPGIVFAGSWAHVYRRLEGAEPDDAQAHLARKWIAKLYEIDARAGDNLDGRAQLRQSESARVLGELRAWLLSAQAVRNSPFRKVAGYAIANWDRLTRFVGDPRIALDSNLTDRTIPGAVVRHENRYASKSRRASEMSATLCSLIETAGLHPIDPARYLVEAVCAADRGEVLMPWQISQAG